MKLKDIKPGMRVLETYSGVVGVVRKVDARNYTVWVDMPIPGSEALNGGERMDLTDIDPGDLEPVEP